MRAKIYVDQDAIKSNERGGNFLPPIVVERHGHTLKAFSLIIEGPSRVIYDPKAEQPRVWIETEANLQIL